jgi:hypothetical protein
MDGKKTIVKEGDPTVFVPALSVHGFKGFKGEPMVVRERADPAGEYKAL